MIDGFDAQQFDRVAVIIFLELKTVVECVETAMTSGMLSEKMFVFRGSHQKQSNHRSD